MHYHAGRPTPEPSGTGDPRRSLEEAARQARDLALERLLEARHPNGSWRMCIDLNAFIGAMYIIMLRTTGLADAPGSHDAEALLVRHMVHQTNPDGGFFKFAGSPSCRTITRLVVLGLRLSLGDVPPRGRPPPWFRRNRAIDRALAAEVHSTIGRAERFLGRASARTSRAFEMDHVLMARTLAAQVDPRQYGPLSPPLSPEILASLVNWAPWRRFSHQFSRLLRKVLPSLTILGRRASQRSPVWGAPGRLLRRSGPLRRREDSAIEALAAKIRAEQDDEGDWYCSAVHTILNVMALREAGASLDDPAIARAHHSLRRALCRTGSGGAFLDSMRSDVWNTTHGVCSYLSVPGRRASDEEIRPSIDFLLGCQGPDGGYAFGSGATNHSDSDCVGFALSALALAAGTAEAHLRARLATALERAQAYLSGSQSRSGGFSCWDATSLRPRAGSRGWLAQTLFDVPSADVTARIGEGLAGLEPPHGAESTRRALRFLLDIQCGNGAWWSRWWAGYVVGTDSVLRMMGRLGLGCTPLFDAEDPLLGQAQAAAMRGIDFLVTHQNADGGWGETIESDSKMQLAGIGASTPLHTAYTASALLRCRFPADSSVIRQGIAYLLDQMTADGRWEDHQATFTIFARTFYYAYPFHNLVLPLNALTDYLRALEAVRADPRAACHAIASRGEGQEVSLLAGRARPASASTEAPGSRR
jgi:hypothetical protein